MTLPIGTKVKINSIRWYQENQRKGGEVSKTGHDYYFISDMAKYCGKILTIKSHSLDIHGSVYYRLEETHYGWHDWMFEPVETQLEIF